MNPYPETNSTVPGLAVILALLVGMSLIANLVCLAQVRSMRREQAAVRSEMSSLRSEVLSTRSVLTSLGREAAWYDTPRVEFTGAGDDGSGPVAKMTWTFRELGSDASVEVSYRASGDWKQAQVRRVGGNTFEAVMPLPDLLVDPVILATFTPDGGSKTQRVDVQGADATLEWVISAEEGGVRKSGQTGRASLAKLGGVFRVDVTRARDGAFNVVVAVDGGQEPGPDTSTDRISRVDIVALAAGAEQSRIELPREPGQPVWNGTLTLPNGARADLLRVTLTLAGGRTVEKDILVR
ncbi:MAG: hypothetical protein ACM3X4_08325 [Ignavibacteriales bacterium]